MVVVDHRVPGYRETAASITPWRGARVRRCLTSYTTTRRSTLPAGRSLRLGLDLRNGCLPLRQHTQQEQHQATPNSPLLPATPWDRRPRPQFTSIPPGRIGSTRLQATV